MVKEPGEEVLRQAVRRFRVLYPEFDYIICYNNLRDGQLRKLRRLGIDLYLQHSSELNYPLTPVTEPDGWKGAKAGWGLKLCPPRLRLEAHELWVDNDLIIRKRLPSIDAWLQREHAFLIAKGHRRMYGDFDNEVPERPICSAGLFGLPPRFNFQAEIVRRCRKKLDGKPLGYYDEQGLVASIVMNNEYVMAKEVQIVKGVPRKPLPLALHFIGTNRYHTHDDWQEYKCDTMM